MTEGTALKRRLDLGLFNFIFLFRKRVRMEDLNREDAIQRTIKTHMKNSSLISYEMPLFTKIRSFKPFP